MRMCRHCGVKLENDLKFCPLCDMETQLTDDTFARDYPYVKNRFSRSLLIKTITFLALVTGALSFLVNYMVPSESPWVWIVAGAILYVWVNMINIIKNTKNPGSILLCQLLTVSGFSFLIDYFSGWRQWSVNYVIPFLIMASAIAIVLFIVIRPVKYRAYTIYQLVIAVLGVLAILLWIFGYSQIEWPVIAAAVVSLLCFLIMLVFEDRSTRNELHKRFHF